jgi:hypothetical protein
MLKGLGLGKALDALLLQVRLRTLLLQMTETPKPLEVVKREYYKWPYAPDVYSAGLCLLYAVRPGLHENQYNPIVQGISNNYLTRSEVKEYLINKKLFREEPADILRLLSKVLCEPGSRLTMAEFAGELRVLQAFLVGTAIFRWFANDTRMMQKDYIAPSRNQPR